MIRRSYPLIIGILLLADAPVKAADASSPDIQTLSRRIDELNKRLLELELQKSSAAASSAAPQTAKPAPFDFADFTWLNGNSREKSSPFNIPYFTPEILVDANYVQDFNNPKDHTLDGSCETGRTNEIQLQQFGVGGDLNVDNVRARLMTQFGMYSTMTPRNDASPSRGQWDMADAYRYLSEANGGYHFDVGNGINVDAGIFMSYVGLFSYYNSENWAYQPSYVSANTPWFFNGIRIQTFPTLRWKSEFWLVNGWQSYGMFNETPGLGTQQLWRPNGSVSVLSNDYWGYDTPGEPAQQRYHTDDSIEVKYYDEPKNPIDKAAFSLTMDAGCQSGDGAGCHDDSFLGFMLYNRLWFDNDHYGLTMGGGGITNPGRYLVLLPPINGATATSGTSYFTTNPGDSFKAWDASVTFDYMPNQYLTWRVEFDHRAANVPYFVGPGGITPPGGNTGDPGSTVAGWAPDLARSENRINLALLIHI